MPVIVLLPQQSKSVSQIPFSGLQHTPFAHAVEEPLAVGQQSEPFVHEASEPPWVTQQVSAPTEGV
jgi:hypothetical protein